MSSNRSTRSPSDSVAASIWETASLSIIGLGVLVLGEELVLHPASPPRKRFHIQSVKKRLSVGEPRGIDTVTYASRPRLILIVLHTENVSHQRAFLSG